MPPSPGSLVVRAHAPLRRAVLIGGAAVVALFAVYVVYELGRYDAGYDRLAVSEERATHEVELERLEGENRTLRVQLAEFETQRVGSTRERTEVARTIGELQAQNARLEQQLAFYRGIVQQGANAPEVKIQQLRIAAGDAPNRFRVRVTIVQPVRPENSVGGTLALRVEGQRAGKATSLDLAALTQEKLRELPFNFRYFENFDQLLTLPAGFTPERVTVEVRSTRKGVAAVTQTFVWSVDAS